MNQLHSFVGDSLTAATAVAQAHALYAEHTAALGRKPTLEHNALHVFNGGKGVVAVLTVGYKHLGVHP